LKNVKLVLADSRVSPADQNNEAIFYAAANGHLNAVKLLLLFIVFNTRTIRVKLTRVEVASYCRILKHLKILKEALVS
jgi:hypothetical protein